MLRRFEIYSLAKNTPAEQIRRLEEPMRNARRYIPEVLHSAIGHNQSPADLQLIWEHGYASPAAYHRYMVHPFHANIYDRYLLNDSAERVVTDNAYDVGLLGYNCDDADYFLPDGAARRLILLRLEPDASEGVKVLTHEIHRQNPKMILSVFAENTFGTRWLDGVTQILESTTYTHIWEQGYASLAEAANGSPLERELGAGVLGKLPLWYEIEGGYKYEAASD
jgi:Stress responsive A/B Barrel Domain